MRTAIAFLCAAATFIALLWLADRAARRWHLHPEVGRKLAHISAGVAAAALPWILPFPAIAGLAAAFIPFMIISRRHKLFPVIHSAERSTFGEIYFPAGVLAAAILVPDRTAFAFGVLVMGVGDAVASLVGQRFGRRRYRVLNAVKSYAGSAALLSATIVFGVLASISAGMSLHALVVVLAIAAVVTVEEGIMGGGADNVVLPVTAAALLRTLL